MGYFAGLDVSLETANICIVDATGDILLEKKVEAEPETIIAALKRFGRPLKRIGLEAGPTSSWLYSELRHIGYPAICLECRHVKAGLSAMRNKTDRNDLIMMDASAAAAMRWCAPPSTKLPTSCCITAAGHR